MLLTLLRDHGPTTQAGLAEAFRLDPSNLVGVLNDLERRGLVTRQHHPEDRRRHIVVIADEGIAELANVECRLAAAEERVLGALDPHQRAALHDLLMRAAGGQLPPDACSSTLD
jgi:DNA-binding MarR family transcriptional regulator